MTTYLEKYVNWAYLGKGFRIGTPKGYIYLIVKEVSGTRGNRHGKIEIHGSSLIQEGSLVELTKQKPVKLADDISAKVSNSPTSGSRLSIGIVRPYYYPIKLI